MVKKGFDRGEVIFATMKETVGQAIDKMAKQGVSQLPVMDGKQIIGLVTESDILAPLARGEVSATDSVTIIMKTDLRTLDAHENMDALLKVFEKNEIAIVKKHGDFIGLVTKIDFIKFLGQKKNFKIQTSKSKTNPKS